MIPETKVIAGVTPYIWKYLLILVFIAMNVPFWRKSGEIHALAARSPTACKHQDRTWPDGIEGSLKGQPSLESKAKLPRSESAKKFADESAAIPIAPLLILFLVGVRLRNSR
jgi:hypothetical protein